MKSNIFVSVVLVHDKPISIFYNILIEMEKELNKCYTDYEIVIIKQGPVNSFSQNDENVLLNIPCIRVIQLSSKVPMDVACAAALENVIGDFIVMFNPIIDPLTVISDTVSLCLSGYDIIVGVANQNQTIAYKICRFIAQAILNSVDYSLPRDSTALRCLSRRAVNSITTTGRYHHQLSMRIQKTGYPHIIYNYHLNNSENKIHTRSIISGFRDLLRLIVFNSSRPLRWMTVVGITGSLFAFFFALYSLLVHLINGHVVEGWTTTIIFMSVLFMLQFIMMAFFGEYLGRLLDDSGDKADYSVVFEKNSLVMVNQNRINVFNNPLNEELNLVQTGRNK